MVLIPTQQFARGRPRRGRKTHAQLGEELVGGFTGTTTSVKIAYVVSHLGCINLKAESYVITKALSLLATAEGESNLLILRFAGVGLDAFFEGRIGLM